MMIMMMTDVDGLKSKVITNVYKPYGREIVLVVTFIRSGVSVLLMIHVLMAIIRSLLVVLLYCAFYCNYTNDGLPVRRTLGFSTALHQGRLQSPSILAA